MKPTKSLRIKLLFAGAFFAITQLAFGQSITVKHYENGNLTTPSFFTNNAPRLCAVDSVQLEATGFSGTLSWSGPNGVINSTATTIWVKDQGWHYVSDGTNNASVNIGKDNSNPEIYSEDYPITTSTNNGIGAFENVASPTGGLYGLLNPTKDYLAPFGAEYAYNKQQYLYTAAELSSMGFDAGTTVKQIGFYLNNSWSGNCNTNVQISVYESSNSTLTNFVSGSSNYLGSWSCDLNYQSGWNYLDLSDFNWNGTDNLVFEFCYNSWGASTAQNPLFALDNVGFAASVVAANVSDVCSSTSGFAIADYRPSTAFKYSNAARKDTVVLCGSSTTLRLTETGASYAWSSANSTYSGTTSTLAVSSNDVVYVTGLTSQFCKYDDTVQVYSAAESVPTITATSTDFCAGESTTLSTTLTTDQTARWSNGGTGSQITVTNGGTYTVTVSNEFGCSKTSSGKSITEVVIPVIYKTSEGPSIAQNESHNVTGGQDYTSSFGPVHHLFDYNGEKYFTTQNNVDSTTYINVLANNDLAEIGVIDNSAIDGVFQVAHKAKYLKQNNLYPWTINIGAKWNNTIQQPVWYNGSSSTYENINTWTTLDATQDGKHFVHHQHADNYWDLEHNWYNGAVLVKYNMSNISLAASGEIFCDSVQLFAPTNFDSYTWSTGETSSSIWVSGSGSHSVFVTGSHEKSDGSICSLTSDTYTFTINDAPELTITNNSGITDLDGTNTISLTASYTTGASLSWSTGATTDNITVSSAGAYTATATLNGCSVSETVNTYEPIFVAKTGNNTTGDGTFANPYLTIQKGINEADFGGKVYVLPGTYEEQILITKGVYLASNFDRIGDSSAIANTIIEPGSSARIEDQNDNSKYSYGGISIVSTTGNVSVSGFTVKDFQVFYDDWWRAGALSINENISNRVEIKNFVIDGTVQLQGGNCCPAAHVLTANNSQNVVFDNVQIINSGNPNDGINRLGFISNTSIQASRLVLSNNYVYDELFSLENSSSMTITNSVIEDELNLGWSQYPFRLEGGSNVASINSTFKGIGSNNNNAAFYVSGSGNKVLLYNTIVDAGEVLYHSGSNNTLDVANSVLPQNADLIHSGLTLTLDTATVFFGSTPLNSDYSLPDNSAAIGLGSANHAWNGVIYSAPSYDLYGASRPNPAGSNIDAGAVESEKAIGDFDANIVSCGYLLTAIIYNSDDYSLEWLLSGNVVSTAESFTTTDKGIYTLNVYSVDRTDTISKTYNLNNPFTVDIYDVYNSCTAISSSNGKVSWGNVQGGTPYTTDWWAYRSAIRNESGTQIDGYWHFNDGQNWSNTKSNLGAGKYFVFVEDATGCEVGDTIEIIQQDQATYFVSNSGNDANSGLSSTDAFASIERAINNTCKGDTVILLDGTYFEDSIFVNSEIVIGSEYIIDGDTNHIRNTIVDGSNSNFIFHYSYQQGGGNWADTTYSQIVGFTIQNGSTSLGERAGAISVKNERDLAIKNMRFLNNVSSTGGAVWTEDWSRVAILESYFEGNEASSGDGGAVLFRDNSYVIMNNCTFVNNTALYSGGGVSMNGVRQLIQFDGNTFIGNRSIQNNAGSLFIGLWNSQSEVTINDLIVKETVSGFAPVFVRSSEGYWVTFNNALIVDNVSQSVGALEVRDGTTKVALVNSTIANNTVTDYNSSTIGSSWGSSRIFVFNSIVDKANTEYVFSKNSCDAITMNVKNSYVSDGSNYYYDNSCSVSSFAYDATTCLSTGLYFNDADNGDYSIQNISTVLGAGANSALNSGKTFSSPSTDLYGNPRPSPTGTSPDLGAIESAESTPQMGLLTVVEHNGFCETSSGSITVNLLNYSGTATYDWESLTDANWSWNSTQTANNLADGTYRVVAVDNTTLARLDSVDVVITTLPNITIANLSEEAGCNGDLDGELVFTIEGGNPFSTSMYQYNIEYLDALSATDGYVVDQDNYHFTSDFNSSNRSGSFSSQNYAESFRNGYYEISVTDEDGCSTSDTLTLEYLHELPQVAINTLSSDGVAGLTSMCSGTGNTISLTANVTGGGGTNSFAWSNASTAQTVGVAQNDEYYVEVTDQYTCVGRDTVDIYFQQAPQLIIEGVPAIYTGQALNDNRVSNSTYLGEFEHHHYYMIQNYYSWTDARLISEEIGGYMWIPNSQEENEYVWDLAESLGVNSNAHIGVYWNGSKWVGVDEAPLQYSNWRTWLDQPYDDYAYGTHDYWGDEWHNNMNYSNLWIVEFEPASLDALVTYNQNFCDSIELKATPFTDGEAPGFTEVYWTDANTGDTLSNGEYATFDQSQEIVLNGVFTRSDGQTCNIESSSYSFQVNNSPNLELTALSGTYDFANGDTLYFLATTDTTGASVSWSNSTSTDTLMVTSLGNYTATAQLNGCSVSETFRIEEAIYVSKTGSNTTGNGSLSAPYKTIQFAIDTAESGSKIYVLPGIYNENLVINKQVRLYSDYVRLGNASAIAGTVINAGFSGRVIEFSNSTRLDKDSTIIDGFTIKNGDVNGDEGSGIYANWNQGSGLTINNSIISYNRKQCCNDGIAIALHGVDLYLNNVDIVNNGSLIYWDERSTVTLRNLKSVWNNVKFRSNEANNSLVYLSQADLEVYNSDFIGNTVHDNNESIILVDWGSNLLMSHVTMTNNSGQGFAIKLGNNDDAKVVLHNTLIDGFAQGGIKTAGASNQIYLVNSVVNSVPTAISGNATVQRKNSLEIPTLGLNLNGTLKSTSPAIGLGGAVDTTIAGYFIEVSEYDLAGNMRPNPAGSRPDAGAYEDSLARGAFGIQVSTCGYMISTTVLNSDAYSVNVTSTNGFNSTEEIALVALKGTYNVTVYDSSSAQTITRVVSITNPLSIGYLWSKDACSSNGGYGEIVFGDFRGGVDIDPTQQWFDYYVDVYDTTDSYSNNWQVHQGTQNTWNASVQSGAYVVELSDGSGCSVYDTVYINETIGSRYYISTTGSDTATGSETNPLSTIQEALGRACDGDTIILFDGEYFENIEINNLSPFVTIASEMILDGDTNHIADTKINGMDEDPVFEVHSKDNSSDEVTFYGFTVTNGYSRGNWYGGGGFSIQNSDVNFENMLIKGNRSSNAGGGIGTEYSRIKITNSIVEDNLSAYQGGGINFNGIAEIEAIGQVIVRNNKSNSNGGGIAWDGHWDNELSLKNFVIENNEAQSNGGGLYFQNGWGNNGGTIEVEGLIIKNNRSFNGVGGAYINANGNDMTLQNTIIAYNKSNSTGGLHIENSDINVVHTTVYKNTVLNGASSNDQIELFNNANVVFLNSAVGGQEAIGASTAHTFYLNDFDQTCDLTIVSSIVSGGTNSIDNTYSSTITGAPLGQALYLTDPVNGDYMLSPVSVGLGAGSTSYGSITIPTLDINGNSRPGTLGENPDVGAVESPLDSAEFGAAYEIRNNIACDDTYGQLKVVPLNGSGSYKFELDDLTGSATFNDQQNVSSYTYSSLYSGDYKVTITDLTSLATFVDTVTISGKDSLSLSIDIVNEFCMGEANGSITLNASGGDGFYDYTWSTANTSGYPKTSVLNNLSPAEYFVTVKDGDNCFIEDSVTITTLHSIPTVAITGQINKGGSVISTNNPQIRACAGDEVVLDAGAGFVTYNWTTIDQLNSWTTQTLDASYEQGFYVTVVDSFGCSNVDSAEVFYVQAPAVYASNVNTNIGASMQSVTSYVEGLNQSLGSGFNDAKPYGAQYPYAKMQFIIPASELIAEGLTDQTTINSIGFEVELESGSPIQSFKIKMKNTTQNQVSSTFETGLTQVYDLNILTPGEGWNTHTLDQGFVWDGTKNLLVQVEYSNVAFSGGSDHLLMGADMSYNASAVARGYSSVSNNTMSNYTSTWRPNFKFGIDKVQASDTLRVCDFTMLNTTDDYDTYSWLVNGTSQSSLLRYSVSSPLEVVLKTVDAASSCTMYSDTVQVLLDTTPTVFASATSLLGCIGDTLTVGLDSTASDITYTWSNGVNDSIGVFTQSGEYYVYANSISGCQGVDTVSVDINIPPDVVVELNGRVLTSTDGSLVADNSACDTTLILPYLTTVDTLSVLNSSEWSTYSDEYLVWEFQQGWDSLVDFTGPQYDADSSYTGGFYQFDPASLTDQNKVGYLQLGCVNLLGMGSPELTFDYHMVDVYADSSNTADQMGSLELQAKAAGDDNWSTVWQRSGTEPAYEWVTKSIALSAYVNKTIQLRWKGTAGVGGPRSEMALDNISINDSLALASNIAGRATPETVCEGDSLFAKTVSNGTSNFSYVWSSGDTTAGVELHSTGWYSVKVVDEKNCLVTTDSVYILVNPAPSNVLVVSDTTQYCEGLFDSLMISSPSGYEHYEWFMNSGSGYLSADTTHALQVDSIANGAQQYYVVITDSLGCRSTSVAVELVQTPTPQLTVSGVDVLCNGDSTGAVSVDAIGSGQWVYSWSNGDTTDTVADLPTDWYTVAVVDQYSCEATDSIFVGEPNPVSLSITAVSNVDCYGSNTGSIDIDFSGGVGGYLFSWTDSTGAWSSGSEDLLNAPAGEYYIAAEDSNGCALFDTVQITEPTQLVLTVDSVLDLTCKGNLDGYIGLSGTGGVLPYTFIANLDTTTTGEFYNLDSNYYSLVIIDSNGCQATGGAVVSQPDPPFNFEEICGVTVDTSGLNLIVWEKTPGKRTSEYVILKENASTQYVSIGSNQYTDMSTFVDSNSNPAVQPYRYRLALIDSCGFYSDTSDYHATIHLQASQGVAQNEVQLQWTPYEGKQVQTYYIYRWLSPTMRVLVDSVSANVQTYTDIYPVNTTITALLYEIGAKFIVGGCSPSAGKQATYAASMSNRLDWGADGGLPIGTEEWVNVVLESDLGLFPNPTQGYLNVVLSGAWEQEENVQMKVLDITGRVIAQRQVNHGGDVRFDFRELPSGVYFLHTMTERGRIIVKRFERIN